MNYHTVTDDILNWRQISFKYVIKDSRPTNSETYREGLDISHDISDPEEDIAKMVGMESDEVGCYRTFDYCADKTGYEIEFIVDFQRHLDWDELFRVKDEILTPSVVVAYSGNSNFTVIDSDRISVKMNVQTDIECKRVA